MSKAQNDFTMMIWYGISMLILVVFGLYLMKKANNKDEITNALGCIIVGLTPGSMIITAFAILCGFIYITCEFIPSIVMKIKKIDPNT